MLDFSVNHLSTNFEIAAKSVIVFICSCYSDFKRPTFSFCCQSELTLIKPQKTANKPKAQPPISPEVQEESVSVADTADVSSSEETEVQAEEETDESPKFQGIGTIYGKVIQNEAQEFFIRLGQNQYRLYVLKNRYRSWLLQMKNSPDTPLYLRVYPKYRIIPRKPPEVYFQVVAWVEENQWEEPGIFIFRGIWQFIPQVRTPVISVYRNYEASDPTEKFKAVHLPVLMRREDETRPFKFNPKIPKEQLPQRWFIQAEFKFIASRNCWGWVKDLETPTTHIPRYRKPVKATAPTEEQARESNAKEGSEESRPKKPFTKPKSSKKPPEKSTEDD